MNTETAEETKNTKNLGRVKRHPGQRKRRPKV